MISEMSLLKTADLNYSKISYLLGLVILTHLPTTCSIEGIPEGGGIKPDRSCWPIPKQLKLLASSG